MRKPVLIKFISVVFAFLVLAGCGGGGAKSPSFTGSGTSATTGAGTGTGTGTGGTTASGIVASMKFATVNPSPTLIADGSSTVAMIATITDTTNQPVAGKTVSFTTNAGKLAANNGMGAFATTTTVVTDASGQANVLLQSTIKVGTATVVASETVTNISSSVSVTSTAGPAANVVMNLAPTSVGPGGTTSINVQVTDGNSNPVTSGTVTVGFVINTSGGQFASTLLPIDANGRASTTYQAGPTTGTDTLQASLANGTASPKNLTVSNAAQKIGKITLALNNPTAVANGTALTAATATVTDTGGVPLANVTISFATSANVLKDSGGTQAATVTGITDGTGTAIVSQVSPTVVGNGTITASVGGFSASQPITFVAGPIKNLLLTSTPSSVAPGGTSTIQATVTDANANPVSAATVKFTTPTNTSGGSFASASTPTDINGIATVVYTGGTTVGADTLKGDAGSGVANTSTVTISASASVVQSLSLALGSTTGVTGAPQTVAVVATVTNAAPTTKVAGQSVTFSASNGIVIASATTDKNGIATSSMTIPSTAAVGTFTVSAQTAGFAAQASFKVTPGVANAGQSSITANPTSLVADGVSTSTITVVENDVNGNPLPDGTPITLVLTPAGAGTLTANSSALASGRATFTIKAPSAQVTATVKVQDVPALTQSISFVAPGAANAPPASFVFTPAPTSPISVKGVGATEQSTITVKVLDTSGNAIDESKYGNAALNNLRAKFVTRPNGGESISGKKADATIASDTGGVLDVRTSSGVAVLTLNSGTISGIVEISFSVLNYSGTNFAVATDVAATGSAPQISIASGPAASIVFTSPLQNAIVDLGGGSYSRKGQVLVRDRYGNFVPDNSAVNFSMIDSAIVHDSTGITAAASPTLTRSGTGLINRRCAVQPLAGNEAGTCTAGNTNDFSSTITRNNATRSIQANDTILIRDAQAIDKRQVVTAVTSTTTLTAQNNYNAALSGATFWVGSALSGGAISGVDANFANPVAGTGKTTSGIANFVVVYPANSSSILTGCYGYNADGSYSTEDKRDAVPQSRQVVIAALAGNNAATVDAGSFCFSAIAGITVTPGIAALTVPVASNRTVGLTITDGGQKIRLPYVGVSCFVSKVTHAVAGNDYNVTVTQAVNSDGNKKTGIDGTTSVTISATGTVTAGDSAAVVCNSLDGTTTITATP